MRSLFTMRVLYGVGVLVGSLALLGCPKRPEVAMAGPGAMGPGAATAPATPMAQPAPKTAEVPVTRPAPPAETPVKPAPAVATVPLEDIFFNFDDATILADQKTGLNQDFAWLKAHPDVKVAISGNCDERGTEEYNLALGERRADTAKNYLVAEGITADRISTISYGKDRPFVLGHDENAWRLNRRDHFVVAAN
ncbi:MAG: peptidoglycan-associated lipoprotein Pal [Candidatus Methylomirabilales bacterium]